MSPVYVLGVGVAAAGLCGWRDSVAVLRGAQVHRPEAMPTPTTSLLPANERRRTTYTIKLALCVAHEAVEHADAGQAPLGSVFASASGDLEVVHKMCTALTLPEHPVSPIVFHNSVHNAPSGYWAIASNSRKPSMSVAAADGTFAAGLLEAATQVLIDDEPILLVVYDHTAPEPLKPLCGIHETFAMAVLLGPRAGGARLGQLQLRLGSGPAQALPNSTLEAIRAWCPAAQGLPLLQLLAGQLAGLAVVPASTGCLEIEFQPCA